ncbi:MAG: class D sortase [Terriglobales bacterium]
MNTEWLQRLAGLVHRQRVRLAMSPVLIILGVLLLGYVGTQYGQMYFEQRHLAQEWQRQQQARHDAPKSARAAEDDRLTRLSVPKIDLDSVVVEGTNHRALLLGPGHMRDTPAPGEIGNSVITGHRDTFFRHIHELEKGDIVLIERDGKTFRYEVTGKRIVEPTDVSVLNPATDSRLTLITCYPTYYIGPAPKRLVVFTKLVGERSESETRTSAGAVQ